MADELLTRRELEVVRRVVDVGSVKVAAYELGIHQRTVERALARARDRAQVNTTNQLVRALAHRGDL